MKRRDQLTSAIDDAVTSSEPAAATSDSKPARSVPGRLGQTMVLGTRQEVLELREQVRDLQARLDAGGADPEKIASQTGLPIEDIQYILAARAKGFELVFLDPEAVAKPFLARRSERHFESEDFKGLVKSIETEGQQIPGYVRPLEGGGHELIVGNRRHRACKQLGRPFIAFSKQMSDLDALKLQKLENEERTNESPWEQADWYNQQLEKEYFKDQQSMADAYGLTKGDLSELLSMLKLPKEVIDAFSEPETIRRKWARWLFDALKEDKAGVLERAKELRKGGAAKEHGDKFVLRQLTKRAAKPKTKQAVNNHSMRLNGKVVKAYSSTYSPTKGLNVKFNQKLLSEDQAAKVLEGLNNLVKHVLREPE